MEIRFPADAPAYRDSNLTVVFRALVDGETVPCAISVEALEDHFGATVAAYAVTLAHRVRYSVQMNAREAMHMLELRTTPQGHPEYRKVCQKMHRLIADKAGHPAIAGMMSFVDHSDYEDEGLGRLQAERRAEARRQGQAR